MTPSARPQPSPLTTIHGITRALAFMVLMLLASLTSIQGAYAQTWQVNLQDEPLKKFINKVADITGKDFILDPRVNGKVNVTSSKALNADEVYELFLGVLEANNINAVPIGNSIKLIPDNQTKQSGLPFDLRLQSQGPESVIQVLNLYHTKAAEILPVIRPLMPQSAHVAAVPSVNALVIADKANNLKQLRLLIRKLDGPEQQSLDTVNLQYVSADAMLGLLSDLIGRSSTAGGNTQNTLASPHLTVIADTSNDRLLIQGIPSKRERVKAMIATLDVMPSRRLGGLKVFKLKHAKAAEVADILRSLLQDTSANSSGRTTNSSQASARMSIIADETQNAIVVNASDDLMQDIRDAITELDAIRQQVWIKSAIVEVSGDQVDQLGLQWAVGGPDGGIALTNFKNTGIPLSSVAGAIGSDQGVQAAGAISGFAVGAGKVKKTADGKSLFGALFQAIETNAGANLLSTPSILTLDNQQAEILVGQNVPFVTGSVSTSSAGASPLTTIERKDVGISLSVIPHVGHNGTIRLEVVQEISSVVPTAAGVNASDIITNRRLIKTTVLTDNQQMIALGGLISDDSSNSEHKVPLLGDLPAIGKLFQSARNTGTKRNLIIFIQPTIVDQHNRVIETITKDAYDNLKMLQIKLEDLD